MSTGSGSTRTDRAGDHEAAGLRPSARRPRARRRRLHRGARVDARRRALAAAGRRGVRALRHRARRRAAAVAVAARRAGRAGPRRRGEPRGVADQHPDHVVGRCVVTAGRRVPARRRVSGLNGRPGRHPCAGGSVSVGARAAAWPGSRPRTGSGHAARTLSRAAVVHTLIIGLATGFWIAALLRADLSKMAGFGLLDAVPASWAAALVLLAAGFALAAASERPRPLLLGAYVVAAVVVLDATAALLYPEARFAWTYKHLGVIDYVAVHGSVDRSIDIYQNWPGFFALNAWLSRVAGISPLAYAPWAQLFFELANVSAIVFALRGLTRDVRLQWAAAWLFVVANWIGQD